MIFKEIVGIMFLVIILDILLFKLLICIFEDEVVVKEFVVIVEVDLIVYGFEMLKVGMNLSDKLVVVFFDLDVKSFLMGSFNVCIV